jgi:hypothetical protein
VIAAERRSRHSEISVTPQEISVTRSTQSSGSGPHTHSTTGNKFATAASHTHTHTHTHAHTSEHASHSPSHHAVTFFPQLKSSRWVKCANTWAVATIGAVHCKPWSAAACSSSARYTHLHAAFIHMLRSSTRIILFTTAALIFNAGCKFLSQSVTWLEQSRRGVQAPCMAQCCRQTERRDGLWESHLLQAGSVMGQASVGENLYQLSQTARLSSASRVRPA